MKTKLKALFARVVNLTIDSKERIAKPLKIRVSKLLYRPNTRKINALIEKISNVPADKDSLKRWEREISRLIRESFLEKVSLSELSELLAGLISYQQTGYTPIQSHHAFVSSYEKTNGAAQEVLHSAIFRAGKQTDSQRGEPAHSLIGNLTISDENKIISTLEKDGYATLPLQLPTQTLNKVLNQIQEFRFRPRGESNFCIINDPNKFSGTGVFDCLKEDLEKCTILNQICNDPLLRILSSKYLNAESKLINRALWYTFPSKSASSAGAQLFHYDLDTLKWLKVFIHLSDISELNGPHEYINGSHKPGAKPAELLVRHYERLEDSEIYKYYPNKSSLLKGSAGLITLADTRCYHKGNVPTKGYRLMLQPIFAPSKVSYSQL